ncbi:hypothetical protein ACFC5X_06170, partial [Streptomyces sp. NPDC055952]
DTSPCLGFPPAPNGWTLERSTPGPMTLDDRFGQTTPTEPADAWPGGHQAQVIADNTGTRPITPGTADRDLGGATVTGLRIGTSAERVAAGDAAGAHTVAHGRTTLRHTGSDGTLAAGATSSLGRTANGVAGTPAPRRTPA